MFNRDPANAITDQRLVEAHKRQTVSLCLPRKSSQFRQLEEGLDQDSGHRHRDVVDRPKGTFHFKLAVVAGPSARRKERVQRDLFLQ